MEIFMMASRRNRTNRKPRRLCLEHIESRAVLADNVVVGDSAMLHIQSTATGPDDALVVNGAVQDGRRHDVIVDDLVATNTGENPDGPDPQESSIWDIAMWIGDTLKGLRAGRGLTQAEVAKELSKYLPNDRSVDQSYVSRVERGEVIGINRLSLFCLVLGSKPSKVIATAEDLAGFEQQNECEQTEELKQMIDDELHTR